MTRSAHACRRHWEREGWCRGIIAHSVRRKGMQVHHVIYDLESASVRPSWELNVSLSVSQARASLPLRLSLAAAQHLSAHCRLRTRAALHSCMARMHAGGREVAHPGAAAVCQPQLEADHPAGERQEGGGRDARQTRVRRRGGGRGRRRR